jgi:hypothetical protein
MDLALRQLAKSTICTVIGSFLFSDVILNFEGLNIQTKQTSKRVTAA